MSGKERSRRLRRAVLAQLSRQAMTLDELAAELDYLGDKAAVKKELLILCRVDQAVGRYGPGGRVLVYESWGRVVERLRTRRPSRRVARSSSFVGGRRVA